MDVFKKVRMRTIPALVVVSVVLLLFGCADLTVYHLPAQKDNPPLVGDLSYYLPRTAITLTGSVTLKSCKAVSDGTGGYKPAVEVSTTLVPIQSTEPDPDNHYYISYEKSRSWMKEINFTVANSQGGMLQNFNGQINDQAGPDIVAAIGTIVQIGGAVATGGVGAPALLAGAPVAPPPDFCPSVSRALKEIKDKSDFIERQNQHPKAGAAAAAAQSHAIQAAQSVIDSDMKKNKLTRTISYKWVPQPIDQTVEAAPYLFVSAEVDITPVIKMWLSPAGQGWIDSLAKSADAKSSTLTSPYLVTLAIDERSTGNSAAKDSNNKETSGLIIRDPAKATLRVCRELDGDCTPQAAAPIEDQLSETTNDVSPRMAVVLPQFGRVMILPEHSGLFENATLTATLNTDGSISTIGYHSISAAATGVSGIGTAAGNATSAITSRNTAIGAVNTAAAAETTAKINQIQAPDVYNKALADCLASQAAIIKAGGKPGPCQ